MSKKWGDFFKILCRSQNIWTLTQKIGWRKIRVNCARFRLCKILSKTLDLRLSFLTLLNKCQYKWEVFFQILWPSHNTSTLTKALSNSATGCFHGLHHWWTVNSDHNCALIYWWFIKYISHCATYEDYGHISASFPNVIGYFLERI